MVAPIASTGEPVCVVKSEIARVTAGVEVIAPPAKMSARACWLDAFAMTARVDFSEPSDSEMVTRRSWDWVSRLTPATMDEK